MDTVQQVEQRRRAVLEQMGAIRSMRRGTVNEQYLKVPHKGRAAPTLCGPYYVLTRKQAGRTVSRRVPGGQVEQARADVAAYRRFVDLCQQFEQLTEQLGPLERRSGADPGKKRRS
jgi:hypothetical protein